MWLEGRFCAWFSTGLRFGDRAGGWCCREPRYAIWSDRAGRRGRFFEMGIQRVRVDVGYDEV